MTTSAPSRQQLDLPILWSEASPARTSAKPAAKPVSRSALGQVSFTNSCVSFAWWDRDSSSWRTSQRSFLEGWTSFSENWPKQGLMRSGHVFRRVLWAPATAGTAGGLLRTGPDGTPGLPTPSACIANDGERPETWLARRERVKLTANNGNGIGMPLTIAAQLLPTPRANSAMTVDLRTQQDRPELQPNLETVMARLLPTPKASDGERGRDSARARPDTKSRELATVVRDRMLPTPTVNDAGNSTLPPSQRGRDSLPGAMLRNDSTPTGGPTYLNPSFVEEMMGFPPEWTA